MTDQEFQAIYPAPFHWLQQTLHQQASAARPVSSLGFKRLPEFYPAEILTASKVVAVQRTPVPPLSAMGLERFADFERMSTAGTTYLDTIFIRAKHAGNESLHFHELVHVVQWRILGPERLLWLYADRLERFGYRNSPLEVVAFDLQDQFDAGCEPFDAEAEVRRRLNR
jgi:hypothetical protein